MPREGTKTWLILPLAAAFKNIEIRYAPGGDENKSVPRYCHRALSIEIRYAPGGGENSSMNTIPFSAFVLRLDMPREGTKTLLCEAYAQTPHY